MRMLMNSNDADERVQSIKMLIVADRAANVVYALMGRVSGILTNDLMTYWLEDRLYILDTILSVFAQFHKRKWFQSKSQQN